MKNRFLKFIFLAFSFLLLVYVSLPSPRFPSPLPNALQSQEPADTEDLLRRAYFTNATREEVMNWYKKEFGWGYRLNYRPEEAQSIIRDQTRSTFLEEIVHPFRESLFINGFEPKNEKDMINIEGRPWRQKIIVRMVTSNALTRFLVSLLTLAAFVILMREYRNAREN